MTKNWAEKKACILGYYQKDGLPLKTVMEMMKTEHNFQASQRAYRQQFQKWAVFKYNRKSRVNHPERHHHGHHGHHSRYGHTGHHDFHGYHGHHGHNSHTGIESKYAYASTYGRLPYPDIKATSLPQLQLQLPKLDYSPPQYSVSHPMQYPSTHARNTATPESPPEASDSYHERYKTYPENEASIYKYPLPILPAPQYNHHQSYYMGPPTPESIPGNHSAESMGQFQPCCQQRRCSHDQNSVGHSSHPQSVALAHANSQGSSSSLPSLDQHSSYGQPSPRSSSSSPSS